MRNIGIPAQGTFEEGSFFWKLAQIRRVIILEIGTDEEGSFSYNRPRGRG